MGLNAAKDLQRNAWRKRSRPLQQAPEAAAEVCPAEQMAHKETMENLRMALMELRPEEKAVFLLRQNGDLTYEEIAELRRSPVGTVKTQMRLGPAKVTPRAQGTIRDHGQRALSRTDLGLPLRSIGPAGSRAFARHVESCQDCRSALNEAEDQRKMLAEAARAVREVPVFNLPGEDLQSATVASEIEALPATIAMPVTSRRRSTWRRVWPIWAAAVLLVVAFGIYSAYRKELTTYETEVAQAKGEAEVLEAKFTTLTINLERDKQAKVRQVKDQFPPQLQATGPGQIRLDTPTNFTVALRDPIGQFQPGTVTTQVLDAKTNALLFREEITVSGEGTIQVPGFKTDAKAARLEILAKVNKQEAKIEATLPVSEPSHAADLALDKSLYYAGDVVFFRADARSLQPQTACATAVTAIYAE